jgi:hypothetical protein
MAFDDTAHQHTPEEEHKIREAALDQTIEASFPASDPPSSNPNPDDHAALNRHESPFLPSATTRSLATAIQSPRSRARRDGNGFVREGRVALHDPERSGDRGGDEQQDDEHILKLRQESPPDRDRLWEDLRSAKQSITPQL